MHEEKKNKNNNETLTKRVVFSGFISRRQAVTVTRKGRHEDGYVRDVWRPSHSACFSFLPLSLSFSLTVFHSLSILLSRYQEEVCQQSTGEEKPAAAAITNEHPRNSMPVACSSHSSVHRFPFPTPCFSVVACSTRVSVRKKAVFHHG